MKYVIVCFAAVMLCGADIYVAENGNDDAPGAKEKPFRTITRARDAAREKRNEAVTIYLRGGTYFLDSAVVFTAEDSGTQSTPRVYTSAPGERAVVYGGRRIQGWSAMGGGVYTASVEPGWVFHQMEENGIAARKARHPNTGYLIVEAGIPQRDKNGAVVQDTLWGIRHSQKEFVYKDGDIPWDIPQAEVFIWAGFDWFGNLIPVKSMDREKRIAETIATTLKQHDAAKIREYLGADSSLDTLTARFIVTLGKIYSEKDLRGRPLLFGKNRDTEPRYSFGHWSTILQGEKTVDFILTNGGIIGADNGMPIYVIARGGVTSAFVENNAHRPYQGVGVLGLYPFLSDSKFFVERRGALSADEKLEAIAWVWLHELGHLLFKKSENYTFADSVHRAPPDLKYFEWAKRVRASRNHHTNEIANMKKF